MAALSTGIALAQLQVEESRQCRHNHTRLTESESARSKQLVMIPTEQLTDCGAARRALEWIKMLEGLAGF